jgi:transcriptional regulator with XRE-family HTH domain
VNILLNSPSEVGRLVRAARKIERLRQDDTAGAVGVSDVFLWKLEKGSPGARLDKILQVFQALGIKLYAQVGAEVAAKYHALAQPKARRPSAAAKTPKRQSSKGRTT